MIPCIFCRPSSDDKDDLGSWWEPSAMSTCWVCGHAVSSSHQVAKSLFLHGVNGPFVSTGFCIVLHQISFFVSSRFHCFFIAAWSQNICSMDRWEGRQKHHLLLSWVPNFQWHSLKLKVLVGPVYECPVIMAQIYSM